MWDMMVQLMTPPPPPLTPLVLCKWGLGPTDFGRALSLSLPQPGGAAFDSHGSVDNSRHRSVLVEVHLIEYGMGSG